MEENFLTGDLADRHHNESPNVEETNTDTRTNQQHDIVDIEPTSGSDFEVSSVGGAAQEVTYDTDDEVKPTLWLGSILPLLLFQKGSLSFVVVFRKYVSIDEMMIRFSGWSPQTHRRNNKPVK